MRAPYPCAQANSQLADFFNTIGAKRTLDESGVSQNPNARHWLGHASGKVLNLG
jgi:hypothetical protein